MQRQKSDELKSRNALGDFRLRGSLMRQMAIGAPRVIGRAVTIKVADDNCGEGQQRDERQRNPK